MAVLWCVRVTENLAKISRVPVWEMAARQDVRVTETDGTGSRDVVRTGFDPKISRDVRHQYSVSRSRPFPTKVARPRGPGPYFTKIWGSRPHTYSDQNQPPRMGRPDKEFDRNDHLHASEHRD